MRAHRAYVDMWLTTRRERSHAYDVRERNRTILACTSYIRWSVFRQSDKVCLRIVPVEMCDQAIVWIRQSSRSGNRLDQAIILQRLHQKCPPRRIVMELFIITGAATTEENPTLRPIQSKYTNQYHVTSWCISNT